MQRNRIATCFLNLWFPWDPALKTKWNLNSWNSHWNIFEFLRVQDVSKPTFLSFQQEKWPSETFLNRVVFQAFIYPRLIRIDVNFFIWFKGYLRPKVYLMTFCILPGRYQVTGHPLGRSKMYLPNKLHRGLNSIKSLFKPGTFSENVILIPRSWTRLLGVLNTVPILPLKFLWLERDFSLKKKIVYGWVTMTVLVRRYFGRNTISG